MKRIQPGPAARRAGADVHPAIPDLLEQTRRGELSRRAFIRLAGLLGLPAAAAFSLAGVRPVPALAAGKEVGGRLRVSMKVQTMDDPARFDWTEKSNVARHIVEYLTITGPDNVTRPYLAERWRASEDLRTSFRLTRLLSLHHSRISSHQAFCIKCRLVSFVNFYQCSTNP